MERQCWFEKGSVVKVNEWGDIHSNGSKGERDRQTDREIERDGGQAGRKRARLTYLTRLDYDLQFICTFIVALRGRL